MQCGFERASFAGFILAFFGNRADGLIEAESDTDGQAGGSGNAGQLVRQEWLARGAGCYLWGPDFCRAGGFQRDDRRFERIAGLDSGGMDFHFIAFVNGQSHDGGGAAGVGAFAVRADFDAGGKSPYGCGEQGTGSGVHAAAMANHCPAVRRFFVVRSLRGCRR